LKRPCCFQIQSRQLPAQASWARLPTRRLDSDRDSTIRRDDQPWAEQRGIRILPAPSSARFRAALFRTRSRRSLGKSPTSTLPKRGHEVISRRELCTNVPGWQASRPTRRRAVGRAEPTCSEDARPGLAADRRESEDRRRRCGRARSSWHLSGDRRPFREQRCLVLDRDRVTHRRKSFGFLRPCPRRIGQRSGWIVARSPKGESGRLPAREFSRRICYSTIHGKLRLW
jgi:hypothetical protein